MSSEVKQVQHACFTNCPVHILFWRKLSKTHVKVAFYLVSDEEKQEVQTVIDWNKRTCHNQERGNYSTAKKDRRGAQGINANLIESDQQTKPPLAKRNKGKTSGTRDQNGGYPGLPADSLLF